MLLIREWEVDDNSYASRERFIHVPMQIGRQNGDTVVLFHLLQQVADLDIGVTVVSIFDFRPLAKERVGLIKKQNGVTRLRFIENLVELFFSLADVLADDLR